jgi:hypothetical protein
VRDDATGLADTALEGETNKQNVIYTTRSASNEDVDGDNAVKVVGTDLGLDAADAIIAFAEIQPEPQSPLYFFSVTDGTEGGVPTTIDNQDSVGEPKGGDVFFTDTSESYHYQGEGGIQYGYNGLLFTETSLGLSRGVSEGPPDELQDILARDANRPLTELYFTVNGDASGAEDSAVEATAPEQRGCTVFKSGLDGNNLVAFTCEDLGLSPNDQIDALAVYGSPAPTELVFSVSSNSQGAAGSAVTAAHFSYEGSGGPLFSSRGNGTNRLVATARSLGLGYWGDQDDIDGLTVVDAAAPRVRHTASCTSEYDPFATVDGGELISNGGVLALGADIAVLFGRTDSTARAIAFNANTCALIQQKDLTASELEQASGMAIVKLAGWAAATPLDDIEYVRSAAASMMELHRFDDTGAFIKAVPFTNINYYEYIPTIMHEPTSNRLFVLTESNYEYQLDLSVFDMPTDDTIELTGARIRLGMPCAANPSFFGVEPSGNFTLTQFQNAGSYYRVCEYSEAGTLLPMPYWWTPQTPPQGIGYTAGGRFYSVTTPDGFGPISIERGTLQ